MMIDQSSGKKLRGFAAMSPEKRLEAARKGGASVPNEQRPFSRDPELASSAGFKGGKASWTIREAKDLS